MQSFYVLKLLLNALELAFRPLVSLNGGLLQPTDSFSEISLDTLTLKVKVSKTGLAICIASFGSHSIPPCSLLAIFVNAKPVQIEFCYVTTCLTIPLLSS